ncbi:hypothetical protein C662_19115 [Thauera sp. 28]|nr:hypothetical protein C662_19115 [Thauera sp. 28]
MMEIRKQTAQGVGGLVVAALFATLVSFSAFDYRLSLQGSDIHSYIYNYDRYDQLFQGREMSLIESVLFEVHFHFWFQTLSDFLDGPEFALRAITLGSCFILAFACMYRNNWSFIPVILVLLHPRFLDFVSSQQRLALALSVLVFSFLFVGYFGRVLGLALSASFHTYIFVISAAFFIYVFEAWKGWRYRYIVLSAVGLVFVSVVMAPLILGLLGDRRAEIDVRTTGLLYTAMWVATYAVFAYFNWDRLNSAFGFLFFVSAFSAIAAYAIGAYSERYIALSIVFMALSGVIGDWRYQRPFLIVYLLNVCISYLYWLG